MVKRDNESQRATGGTTTTDVSGATAASAMERRVMAFAEQLGRIAGTIQAKAEGWMDRETLNEQIADVRDGAAHLLEQLAAATKAPKKKAAVAVSRQGKGRSGGVVDAPGKKHRKPPRNDPNANVAHDQANKLRTAKTMMKTYRRRGRG
jgi:hypothetical protein